MIDLAWSFKEAKNIDAVSFMVYEVFEEMQIRRATTADAEAIANIQVQAWRNGFKGMMPDEYLDAMSAESNIAQWHESLNKADPVQYFVIEYMNVLSGFYILGPSRDNDITSPYVGELIGLHVLPMYWGRGLGTMLLKHAIDKAKKNQWRDVYLWVIKDNVRARRLYESFGFKIEGYEKIDSKLTGQELHEVRYIKELA